MIGDLRQAYSGAWRFMLACPILFAIPVLVEAVQHVIEYQLGMYDGIARAQVVEGHPARMIWGTVKVATLVLAAYWVTRFLGRGRDAAGRIEPVALRLFAPVMLWALAWGGTLIWGGKLLAAIGIGDTPGLWIGVGLFLCSFLLEILLACWKVGAALGNPRLGFARSIALVGPRLGWSLGFTLLAILPPMVLHYILGVGAIGNPLAQVVPMLIADSLLVGCLGTLMATVSFVIAERAAGRVGICLVAAEAGESAPLRPIAA